MMVLYMLIVGILTLVNPILGVVGVFLCVGIHILIAFIFGDEGPKHQPRNKTSYEEYDEFDCWQDNQGL